MKACMGGFCPIRDRCQNYEFGVRQYEPSERLCSYGKERPTGFPMESRIVMVRKDKK